MFPKSKYISFLWFIVVLFISGSWVYADNEQYIDQLISKATASIQKSQLDSALVLFQAAADNGMSSDSTLFYFGQVFIVKGALDTALALNLSVKIDKVSSQLKKETLLQRLFIYKALGWEEDIQKVREQLQQGKRHDYTYLIPFFNVNVGAGKMRYERTSGTYGEYSLYSDKRVNTDLLNTPTGYVNLQMNWLIPGFHEDQFKVGGIFNISKTAFDKKLTFNNNLPDSVYVNAGLTLRIDPFIKKSTIDYQIQRNHYGTDSADYSQRLSISRSFFTDLAATRVSLGFASSFQNAKIVNSRSAFLSLFLYKLLPTKFKTEFMGSMTGIYNNQKSTEQILSYKRIEDTLSPFLYYTDSTASTLLALPTNITQIIAYQSALTSIRGQTLHFPIKLDYLSFSPDMQLRQKFFNTYVSFGVMFGFTYFIEQFKWFTYEHSADFSLSQGPDSKYTNVKSRDGDWYIETNSSSVPPDYYPVTIKTYSKHRNDYNLIFKVMLERTLYKIGTFSINGNYAYYWTTIDRSVPVVIPKSGWSVGLNYAKEISFVK